MSHDIETPPPPERCPVCDWAEDHRNTKNGQVIAVYYNCGARWARYTDDSVNWVAPCDHAMTAALRTGATLTPSPLELARDKLVEAAVAEQAAYEIWGHGGTSAEYYEAEKKRKVAVAAYRTLVKP